jgi:hypothetical protein
MAKASEICDHRTRLLARRPFINEAGRDRAAKLIQFGVEAFAEERNGCCHSYYLRLLDNMQRKRKRVTLSP